MTLAAVVWHYWIAVALLLFAVIPLIVATVAGYLNKVVRPRYPSRQQRRP